MTAFIIAIAMNLFGFGISNNMKYKDLQKFVSEIANTHTLPIGRKHGLESPYGFCYVVGDLVLNDDRIFINDPGGMWDGFVYPLDARIECGQYRVILFESNNREYYHCVSLCVVLLDDVANAVCIELLPKTIHHESEEFGFVSLEKGDVIIYSGSVISGLDEEAVYEFGMSINGTEFCSDGDYVFLKDNRVLMLRAGNGPNNYPVYAMRRADLSLVGVIIDFQIPVR